MNLNVETSANVLFPPEGTRVGNVKFFRGLSLEVTAEQLAEQLMLATAQIEDGRASRVDNIDLGIDG